ncbi:hypothetical protein NCAS_0B06860 [Naumovozyma castellii]|uniref:[PSI+] induction protein 2 n=1 Tax=Naumovozyma castellii TaxID=27288 RepID=G0VA40_NAUCA|nr:hypothetical protein NCAS_0B06860 [Naumovozyma castellii CBS 4309]CCC68770.1 hypothetical protein NCAS_0B06860 [Naumovozyma castellii CBS 4309]
MNICQIKQTLFPRAWTDDIVNTGKSFKNWDSCMNDKPCKIIAIVGICLAVIVGLWLIGALLTCFRQGVTGIGSFICWCCSSSSRSQRQQQMAQQQNYNPAMPSQVVYQPVQQPESAYYNRQADSFYDERTPGNKRDDKNEVFELEQDFDLEKQKAKSQARRKKSLTSTRGSFLSRWTGGGGSNANDTSAGASPAAVSSQQYYTDTARNPYPNDDVYQPYGGIPNSHVNANNNNTNAYNPPSYDYNLNNNGNFY